jgi:hypothetical protein
MDPEIQRDYEEHMRTMVDLLNQQATATSKLLNSLQSTSKAADAVKSNTEATKKQTEVLSGSTKALEAGAVAQQKYAEAAANFSRGLISGQAAVTNFGKALIDGQKNLEKYGNAFDNAGDAAWDIGKNFGVLGMVVGGAAKALGFFAAGIFKSVDSVVQFRDETSKFAGILPTTLSGIQELGSNARFSGEEIMKLSKTMSGFGTNILSLGGSAGEGALRFMEMAAVTDDVRRKFGRLGVDQDRLLEMQGMYIQMQGISGKALENRTKTEGQLQRESLAYAKNLIIMSDLTGQTAEQMQQEREIVKAEFEEQVKIRQENIQIQRLRAAGEHEAADAIKKEQDNRTQLIQTMTDTYGRDIGSQFGRLARTGVYDQFTSGLATLGVSATEVSNIVKTSGNIQADSLKQAQKVTDLQNNMVERVGDSFQFMGEESARALLGSTEAITKGNNYLGKNLEEEVEKSKKAAAAKEAEGDAMADAVEQIRSSEREIQKLYYDSMYALAEIVVPKFAGALEWATQKLFEIINTVKDNFDWFIGEVKKWAPILAVITGAFIGMKVATTVVSLFNGLAKGTKGLTSVFSGLRNALSGAINWIRGLVGGGGGGGGAPKKGADGRYRDAQGRFAKAPKGGGGSRILNVAKGAGRILGKLALPLAGAFAAYDAYQGFNADPNASFGGKMANAGKSALSGLTFGLSEYITGGVTTGTPEQKAATEKQVTAATTNKTASEGMATASADFKNTVAELAKTNKESYEKIVSASTGGQTTEEIEKRKEATTENNEALASNTKNFANSTDQTIKDIEQRKILSKNSQEQMKQQTALFKKFTDAMDSAALMVTTLKDAMKGLVNQIGTSLTQLQGASVGGSANSLATVESMMAFNKALESGGGKHLRATKLGGAPTIGGAYGMGQAARSDAFTKYATDQERAELARLGFTSTPTLDQLVNKEGTAFLSPQAEQADELLARIHARGAIADVTSRLGRAPTNAEMRGAHHLGIAGFTKFQRELTTNPNMTMEAFIRNNPSMYPEDTNISQFGGRNLSEQSAFFGSEVDRVLGGSQQQRIRQLAMTLKGEGFNVSGHPDFNPTGGHKDGSLHYSGRALDINIDGQGPEWNDPPRKARFDALRDRLTAQQFEVIWGTEDHKDHLHIELAKGGIVSGPASGYPATLHGTEVVTPLNMDSILMRLAKTPAAADGTDGMLGSNVTREALDRMSFAQKEMIDVLTRKLDNMIDALDDGNSTRTRILRNSMV